VRDDQSSSVSLPQAGQKASYTTDADGDLEKGVSWPSPRFIENGNNTITDLLTGLMWQKTLSQSIRNWANALSFVNDLAYVGSSNWRHPNRKEPRSLINYGESNIATQLNNAEFAAVQSFYYWTSNPYPVGTQHAWVVFMSQDQVFLEFQNTSTIFWKSAWAAQGE
jgi:hypothetical protein